MSYTTLEVTGFEVMQVPGQRGSKHDLAGPRPPNGRDPRRQALVKRNSADSRFLDQAINEYEIASRFKHPAIRRVLTFNGSSDG